MWLESAKVQYEYSRKIQEKIPVKNIEERLVSLAVLVTSEQALHLCRVVG